MRETEEAQGAAVHDPGPLGGLGLPAGGAGEEVEVRRVGDFWGQRVRGGGSAGVEAWGRGLRCA
jgi:hypothetical protein